MSSIPKLPLHEPIAIIGSACHFAGGVNNQSELWDLLRNPRDVRSEIPDDRFNAKRFYHPNHAHHGHSNVMHSYLIEGDVRAFDAEFFGIKPVEAAVMDPQQRVLMETVYESIEAAGMTLENLKHSDTGVFVGAMCADFEAMQFRDLDAIPTYLATGSARSILSNRISYFFDWHGPSMTIDTACSSSLVAVHLAVKALRTGESKMAVVGGSNLILGPESYIMESKLKMLSPDGIGRMWDKDANGYARGDGVASIVLKTLSSAIADGDHIECVIRETGVNQDGTTTGITMPSVTAQQALIERTYANAGLNLHTVNDQPQLFEAHGTGTPAGDPIEAEAISRAFLGHGKPARSPDDPLFVGSFKTILGHTEGTAGIAAILKASLEIQHGQITPNLHFETISPTVAPFYDNLQIPKLARPWPKSPKAPRRASVNSFGFGGTNAHAILESYEADSHRAEMESSAHAGPLFSPFLFSATSERSLRANLQAFATHLGEHTSYNAQDISYTLSQRRSAFSRRVAYPSLSLDDLRSQILSSLEDKDTPIGVKASKSTDGSPPKILGVFTGQGAQYPQMGKSLIEKSPTASRIIKDLESHLLALPEPDRPSWSLRSELLTPTSRVHEAAISQPLCTAIQILLVDLLRTAGVKFDIVVGHSSGEIAAAYSAGYLTARDAILIAYYRGLHCKHASSPNKDAKGAMLAVGTSLEDATELCEDDLFAGRISVAACNSSSSITISGDEDAIDELEAVLQDEGKFHRRLRVDQAYHSLHMLPCAPPYIESLLRAGVKSQIPPESNKCLWYSSVYNGNLMKPDVGPGLEYWAENMIKPVLFNQALTAALTDHVDIDAVLEVGPHPALKGPASQSISELLKHDVPYHGCLDRNMDSIQAMSKCLGFLWSNLGNSSLDLLAYETAVSGTGEVRRTLVKGLPSYQWDHGTIHWQESRKSRKMRLSKQTFHQLLGDESPDSSPHHFIWKNVLKPSEIPWLEGHQVEGQIVFPAAGYVSTATEAGKFLASGQEVRLIELSNFFIQQAITFEENNSAIEVLIQLSDVDESEIDNLRAKFTYSAALGTQATELTLVASADVRLILGSESLTSLPKRGPPTPHLINVEPQRLYGFMESLGYNFSGSFRALKSLKRKLGRSSCEFPVQIFGTGDDGETPLLIHPTEFDAAFQSIILAYSYPGDDKLRSLHLPTNISKIRVNPALCALRAVKPEQKLIVDSKCHRADRGKPVLGFTGHFDLYISDHPSAALQVDEVRFMSFAGVTNKDRNVFHKIDWVLAAPNGDFPAGGAPDMSVDQERFRVLSRIACFYLRKFDEEVPVDSPSRTAEPLCHFLNYARHMTKLLRSSNHKYAKTEWIADTLDDVMEDVNQHGFSDNADVKIMLLVGETMPRVFAQETTMIEHMRASGLLDEYYADGFGTKQSVSWLGNTVKQITDRHPHLNILEIGAGTGGATKSILKSIGRSFDSYTFTDISSSFFENAADLFSSWGDRMVFKVYDVESDPAVQGFDEKTKYDVIVASLVIHATAELDKTMRNLRKLLKPGGYLVVAEGSSDGPLQSGDGFIFGGLPGWWLGVKEGRVLSPFINTEKWDALLKRTGFSGIDGLAPPEFLETFGLVLFVSQAVDEQISFLREPLAINGPPSLPNRKISKLVIIGGITEPVSTLARQIGTILESLMDQLFFYLTLEEIDHDIVDENSTVISLVDLDAPTFNAMTPERWLGFKKLFETGKTLLWISTGRLADEPLANMPVGFGRSALNETPDLHAQFLDFPALGDVKASVIAESLLRLHAKDLHGDDLLWTVEPELVIDEKGRYLVPRINPITAANERYNSIQRPLFHDVDVSKSPVELHSTYDCSITEISRYDTIGDKRAASMKLRTSYTVLSTLKTDAGHHFLSSGIDSLGCRYMSLLSRPTSILEIPRECAVAFDIDILGLTEASFLTAVAAHLIAMVIIAPVLPGRTVMLHNAPLVIADAVEIQASLKNISMLCTTDAENDESIPETWIRLPPYISSSELFCLLPKSLASFVGLSLENSDNERSIIALLPSHCIKQTANNLFMYSPDDIDTNTTSGSILTGNLKTAIQFAQNNATRALDASEETVSLESVITKPRPRNPIAIVNWTSPSPLRTQVARLDSIPMFKNNRTYWLCGMSGSLGISLCDWMIDRGVTYLVITSRNPKIDVSWVEDHRRKGVNVNIMPCDVTDEIALKAVHDEIVRTMPPIAGALNGAMVLSDSSIPNMQYDQVMDVVRPKVLGSSNLDQLFYDVNLDFFILVSSINCIVGNVGQANYAAANMYVCSLAAKRRKRGLNAAAVNIGAVIGAGYITRETDRGLDNTVEKNALMHLSEDDFHQIIAEAIEAGYPDSPSGPEITTGLLDISPDSPNIPKWYSNPRFSRFLVHQTASAEDKKEEIATASIQDQLYACKTESDLSLLVRERFGDQLRKILQTPAGILNDEILSKSGKELGLDSLVSVDIRSWFSKNFQVSVPVLKIMSNETMSDLVRSSLESIPAELTPQMDKPATEKIEEHLISSTDSGSAFSVDGQESASDISFVPIDWEAESSLPSDLVNIPLISDAPPALPPRVVVITGATGYLGTHLINHILKSPSVEMIHCLAVRKLETRLQNNELLTDPRVKYYQGNLSEPLFGLSKQQADSIFAETDAIIHNGADTSHIKYFTDLRAANVGSTIALARFCLPRRIPFHYISTAGISIYTNLETFPPISISGPGSKHPPTDGSFGYACSKWVNERLLERVHEQYPDFPVYIYRPSTIIREGVDDVTAQAELDWVNSLLRYIRKLKIAPQVENNHGVLDLVRIDSCCDGILSRVSASRAGGGIEYVNQVGDAVISLDGLQDIDAKERGSYAVLPLHEWISEATAAGLHPAVALLIQDMDGPGRPAYPKLLRDSK
ncbi:polyketide synthase [Annulohypoxylon maeteangense]|uniref:polyketide synthase n=1 Tax=Annulohypoxylon maeteangense TaxID=1927788 RepID=UPI00200886E2|nr:polyketide synthase [Annulohypoxylon maeteangense]KAI0889613.1 polyketide synthase [Annulohypoxylon maeteangense]